MMDYAERLRRSFESRQQVQQQRPSNDQPARGTQERRRHEAMQDEYVLLMSGREDPKGSYLLQYWQRGDVAPRSQTRMCLAEAEALLDAQGPRADFVDVTRDRVPWAIYENAKLVQRPKTPLAVSFLASGLIAAGYEFMPSADEQRRGDLVDEGDDAFRAALRAQAGRIAERRAAQE